MNSMANWSRQTTVKALSTRNSACCTVADAVFHCDRSVRIPWIPVLPKQNGIDLYEPWQSYPLPESQCCADTDPDEKFDAQGMLLIIVSSLQ